VLVVPVVRGILLQLRRKTVAFLLLSGEQVHLHLHHQGLFLLVAVVLIQQAQQEEMAVLEVVVVDLEQLVRGTHHLRHLLEVMVRQRWHIKGLAGAQGHYLPIL
jgi:hypothetical protein